jgi:DNA-binding IclR family transcriptional regulator
MEQKDTTTTIEKALDVLFCLHDAREPQGVTAIARGLDMPKSSVHRLLTALSRRGLVEQDERGRYRPGIALVALGLGALEREPIVEASHPVLEEQAAAVGETFFLVAARGGKLMVLDKAEGNGFLRASPRIGSVVPVHATAVGKLHLAFAPASLSMEHDFLHGFTAYTLTSQTALDSAIEQVRAQGWASNIEEWQPGLAVLAAPVLIQTHRLVATVALAMTTPRLHELGLDKLARRLVAAADYIALRLEGKSQ